MESVLPNLPPVTGMHRCWVSTTHSTDTPQRRRRYGYRFGALRPIDAVARIAPRPLLIIHGEDDALTPVEHAHRLYAAARAREQSGRGWHAAALDA